MIDQDTHAPTPEFRAALERRLIDALRAGDSVTPITSRHAPRRRWRTAAAIAAGLLLGVSVNFAAGQVQQNKQRDSVVATLELQQQLAALKLDLARSEADLARRKFGVGAVSSVTVAAAEAELRAREIAVAKAALDIAEAQATAAAPRDEMWAKLVNGRDFVLERLKLDEQSASQRLLAAKAALDEAQRGFQAGAVMQAHLTEMQLALQSAQDDLDLLARKELLRRETIEKKLHPDDATRRLQQMEAQSDVRRAQRELGLAQQRLAIASAQLRAGTMSELDAKRLELNLLERQGELAKLMQLLKALEQRKEK
ncbi:MAG TPA: hypothetical protein VE967_18110 [Gemmatimonadaceae bacterium]|nr:hypothetical protein [Gemmatimonadaceae bacterium]